LDTKFERIYNIVPSDIGHIDEILKEIEKENGYYR